MTPAEVDDVPDADFAAMVRLMETEAQAIAAHNAKMARGGR